MTRKQLMPRMQAILLRRRDALRRSVAGELSHFSISDERVVGDTADAAVDDDYGLVNSHLAEVESRELMRIEQALERLRRGEYGVCEECGRQIPVARLQALPYASTCVKCQQTAESSTPVNRLSEHQSRGAVHGDRESNPSRASVVPAA